MTGGRTIDCDTHLIGQKITSDHPADFSISQPTSTDEVLTAVQHERDVVVQIFLYDGLHTNECFQDPTCKSKITT